MNNIMLDIETLDTNASAVVLSIGAVKFNVNEIGDTFHMTLSIEDQISKGRTISGSTVKWWMAQSDAARQSVIQDGLDPRIVLENLASFMTYDKAGLIKVWGNGAMFDNVIVLNLFQNYGIDRPWSYKGDRCYRSVRAEHVELYPAFSDIKYGTAHNALDDAIAQAKTLQKIWIGDQI